MRAICTHCPRPELLRRSAARRCSKNSFPSRTCSHSCQTHNPLLGCPGRTGGQGRALSRSSSGRRHSGARRALSRRRRGRTRVLRYFRKSGGPLGGSLLGFARGAHARYSVLRGRRDSLGGAGGGGSGCGRRKNLRQFACAGRSGADRCLEPALRRSMPCLPPHRRISMPAPRSARFKSGIAISPE